MSSKDEEIIDQFLTDIDADGQDVQDYQHDVQDVQNVQEVPSLQNEQSGQQDILNSPHEEQQNSPQLKMKHPIDTSVPIEPPAKRTKCNDLSVSTKWAIVARYMEEANRKTDRLYPGSLPELCDQFGVSKRTIQRVVGEYKVEIARGVKIPDLSNKKSGRFDVKAAQELEEKIATVRNKAEKPLTVRQLATEYEKAYGKKVSYMTLYRHEKRMEKDQSPSKSDENATSYPQHVPVYQQYQQQHYQYQPHLPLSSHSSQSTTTSTATPSSTSLVGGYDLSLSHADLTTAQDAMTNAAGINFLYQHPHQQFYDPQAHMFTMGTTSVFMVNPPPEQVAYQRQQYQQQTIPQAQRESAVLPEYNY